MNKEEKKEEKKEIEKEKIDKNIIENEIYENKENVKTKPKTLKIFSYIFIYLFILILGIYTGFSLIAPQKVIETFGIKPFVVKSNSMKPVFQRGDILIVTKIDSNNIKNGDIIAVKRTDNKLIAHIIADQIINEDHKLVYKTRPLENVEKKTWDAEGIRRYQIVGKVRKAIPKIGYIIFLIQNKYFYIPAILILIIYLIFSKYKNKEELEVNLKRRKK